MDISVVVPFKDESSRLPQSLETILTYFDIRNPNAYEVILVDDGSTDDTLVRIASIMGARSHVRIIRHAINQGKGRAVQTGILQSAGELVLFSDADLSTPISEFEKLEAAIRRGADIAIGSRALPKSIVLPRRIWYRDLLGRGSNLLIRMVLRVPFRDTQCGFKLFRRDVAHTLFADIRMPRWSFDFEVLHAAHRQDLCVEEIAVRWQNAPGSKLKLWDVAVCLLDLFKIRFFYFKNSL